MNEITSIEINGEIFNIPDYTTEIVQTVNQAVQQAKENGDFTSKVAMSVTGNTLTITNIDLIENIDEEAF